MTEKELLKSVLEDLEFSSEEAEEISKKVRDWYDKRK